MRPVCHVAPILIATALTLGVAAPSDAAFTRSFTFKRPSSSPVYDVTLGPGAAKKCVVSMTLTPLATEAASQLTGAAMCANVNGCGVPSTSVLGNQLTIIWPTECVLPGDSVRVSVTSNGTNITCGTGSWFDALNNVVAPVVCALGTCPVPGWDIATLVALSALCLTTGALALARRRPSSEA